MFENGVFFDKFEAWRVTKRVSRQHLDRYVGEYQFRYNARKMKDGQRAMKALKGTVGKRLVYKEAIKKD